MVEPGAAGNRRGEIETDLHKATDLNPNWGDRGVSLRISIPIPMQKIADLKKAAALDRRNIEIWKEMASVATKANQFADAAKAWSGAERAAANDRERESIQAARLAIEGERSDFEAAKGSAPPRSRRAKWIACVRRVSRKFTRRKTQPANK